MSPVQHTLHRKQLLLSHFSAYVLLANHLPPNPSTPYISLYPFPAMLTRSPRTSVSNMLNRLHGQPESYDKKYVPNYRSPVNTTRFGPADCCNQGQIPFRTNTRRRYIWNRQGGRQPIWQGGCQDHPKEEREGQRENGIRRARYAPAPKAPQHRPLRGLVRVKGEFHRPAWLRQWKLQE